MEQDPRPKIEEAFRKLPIRPDQEWLLPSIVNALAQFSGKTNRKTLPGFVEAGRSSARKELDQVARSTELLVERLKALHQPSILALAQEHLLVAEFIGQLERVAGIARAASLNEVPERVVGGRPKKVIAVVIAGMLASNYETLTGKKPTISTQWETGQAGGAYLSLVQEIFTMLSVKASAEAHAREILRRRKEKTSLQKPT